MLLRISILIWILAAAGARTLYMRSEPLAQVPVVIGFLIVTSIFLVILADSLKVMEPQAKRRNRSPELARFARPSGFQND